MDAMQLWQEFCKSIRFGAGFWGTFRLLTNLVYMVCWIVALPVEVVLNRRMGRRYIGVLPVTLAFLFLLLVLGLLPKSITSDPRGRGAVVTMTGIPEAGIIFGVVLLGLGHHLLANWWRFRSNDQVHSKADGIPIWLYPPRDFMTRKDVEPKAIPIVQPIDWHDRIQATRKEPGKVSALVRDAVAQAGRHLAVFLKQWGRGDVPTGPVPWFLATIVHPVLLVTIATWLVDSHRALATVLVCSAAAMFVKARIQKALVVEQIYDLFDARIEQQLSSALADPVALRQAERAGIVVPGIVRGLAAEGAQQMESKSALPPEFASLITLAEGGRPAAAAEAPVTFANEPPPNLSPWNAQFITAEGRFDGKGAMLGTD